MQEDKPKNSIRPNFLVVGAAKAGTTSFYHYIKQIDGVYVSPVKEPHYFTAPEVQTKIANVISNSDDYYRLFTEGASVKWRGEMSVTYLYYAEQCIPRILSELGPDTRIGIMLRDPVQRSYSSYLYCQRHNSDENLDFVSALDREADRMKNPDISPMMHYANMSLYSRSVAAFKRNFRYTKVFLAEDLAHYPKDCLSDFVQVLDGLEVSDNIDFSRHNTGGTTWKNERLGKAIKNAAVGPVRDLGKKIFPTLYPKLKASLFDRLMRRADPIPPEAVERLKSFFRDDILELEQIIQRDLTHWRE